jgi:2-keto-4-pentenoate hydratase/2-oxohepta-3-ene-1,7-dioic acid hydratase in catechol pathway
MRKVLWIVVALLGSWFALWQIAQRWGAPTASAAHHISAAPALDDLVIAPRAEALTFARYMMGDEPHLMLVNSFSAGKVTGVDVQKVMPTAPADPVTLFNTLGYEPLQNLTGPLTNVAVAKLVLPFSGTDNQSAVGINYRAHAEETSVRDSFMFPKRTRATPHNAAVATRGGLLDYEIELGFVLLADLPPNTIPKHMGLVLASDYTDRASLMRHINLLDVNSGEGFTTGKSQLGFMPIGNLFVIPKDYLTFYPSLKLELWCNGEKRQEAHPNKMNWDIRRMFAETFAREGRVWAWRDGTASLPSKNGQIPERTIFLSGTPGGVIFRKPTPRQLFLGFSELFFSLNWFHLQSVIEPYIREEYRAERYLRPGDLVQMRADRLGSMSNSIVAE